MKQQGYGDDPLLCVVINGNRGTCRENPIAKEFTDLKLWYGRHPGKLDNHLLADAKIRNFNLEEILEVTPTTTPATTPTTKSTTSPVPTTTTPSTPSLTTTTLPPTTPEQTLDIKIWAGMVIYGIMVNGVRTGNNHGGGILDVPMQQGETVLALEYGVKRDQEGEPWANGRVLVNESILFFAKDVVPRWASNHGPSYGNYRKKIPHPRRPTITR